MTTHEVLATSMWPNVCSCGGWSFREADIVPFAEHVLRMTEREAATTIPCRSGICRDATNCTSRYACNGPDASESPAAATASGSTPPSGTTTPNETGDAT